MIPIYNSVDMGKRLQISDNSVIPLIRAGLR